MMPRLIDGDKLKHAIHAFVNKYGLIGMSITDFNIMLERNRVDAIPVVRCKDCIHYGKTIGGIECQGYCKKTEYMTKKDDDFCSWGERKCRD